MEKIFGDGELYYEKGNQFKNNVFALANNRQRLYSTRYTNIYFIEASPD